VLKFRTVFQLQ